MALDSKDSDIEQLRCHLASLNIHSLDTSIGSGPDFDTDDAYPGTKSVDLFINVIVYCKR